jgi:hypothetical protein
MAATTVRFSRQPARMRRRLKPQHVSTVAGLALALVLAVTVARSESEPHRSATSAEQRSLVTWQSRSNPRQPEQVAYYLVTSEEGAQRVRSWAWYEHALLAGEPGYRRTTYVPILRACDADLPTQASIDLASNALFTSVQMLVADVC